MAIAPIRSNPRILAQQGVFTVHGADMSGLEELFGVDSAADGVSSGLVKIEIDQQAAPGLCQDLEVLQIHEFALFPELPTLAKHLLKTAAGQGV